MSEGRDRLKQYLDEIKISADVLDMLDNLGENINVSVYMKETHKLRFALDNLCDAVKSVNREQENTAINIAVMIERNRVEREKAEAAALLPVYDGVDFIGGGEDD